MKDMTFNKHDDFTEGVGSTYGFLLCWLTNISSSIYRYWLYHGANCLRNINEVYSASAFLFIFSYRAEVTRNISTAGALAVSGYLIGCRILQSKST